MNQTPSMHVAPEYTKTLGKAAYEFGASFGIALDEWQQFVMNDWLALDDDGKWVCSTCGLSVPRQNGKTALVKVRVMLGIFSLGETILFTCHEVRTSRQVFDSLSEILNPVGEFPELAAQVQYIKRSNGYEEIKVADWYEDGEWHKGGKLLFSSRSNGASRGFTADVVVADEAMYMTDEQVAALVPTMASASGGDMQFIMLGTPPSPCDNGTVFKNTREAAKKGEKGISWCEWGADEIGDIHDWERIKRYNPSLDRRLMRKAVENELAVMSPDTFARERLGWWSPTAGLPDFAIVANKFEALAVDNAPTDGKCAYGVKFAPDGSEVSLAAARLHDGKFYIEHIAREPMAIGTAWLADWIAQRKSVGCCCVIDGKSGAQALVEKLGVMPINYIVTPSVAQVVAACSTLVDCVNEGTLEWLGHQSDLLDSAITSTRRKIGSSGGWGFGGTNPLPIEAASLALWGVSTSKRNPERKLRVG